MKNARVKLQCGVTVRGDLSNRHWAKAGRRGYHELGTERFLATYLQCGDTVVDVGAHVGILTAIMSQLVCRSGKVVAFEVDDLNFNELMATIIRNHLGNVVPEHSALGENKGISTFIRPQDSWGSFRVEQPLINSTFHSDGGEISTHPMTTLDEYARTNSLGKVDLIKIDVDGPELLVLYGAANTIKTYQPALIVEVSIYNSEFGNSFEEIFNFISKSHYTIFASIRTSDEMIYLRPGQELSMNLANASVNLFCVKPDLHLDRLDKMWFWNKSAAQPKA